MHPEIQDYIRAMQPYVPGKPIEETKREFKLKKIVKLASNENPLGPSPKALLAMRKFLPLLHRYPDGSAFDLKHALSSHCEVSQSSLFVGHGSNEIIDLLIRAFCVRGDSIVTSQAAFMAYRLCAQIHGVKTLEVPISDDLKFDLKEMVEYVQRKESVKLVFLANPNNPTGMFFGVPEIRAFLSDLLKIRQVLVVLDVAYLEYMPKEQVPDPCLLFEEFPNLVGLRTFSKIYGLAGLRVGYAVAQPEIVSILEKVRQPFNVNALAMVGACAALQDPAFVKCSQKTNELGQLFWKGHLKEAGIPFWECHGNFILINTQKGFGKSGIDVYQECLRKGVIFRPVANYGLNHALRISIGSLPENEFAWKALLSLKRGV